MAFRLIFLSSSRVKREHFKYLMRDKDIELLPPKDYGQAYNEPRIGNRELLLKASVSDANKRLARGLQSKATLAGTMLFDIPGLEVFENAENREELANLYQNEFFFIEDTSVIINALSRKHEYPGVDIKYWMQEHDFYDVDHMLKDHKNDRSVAVRSDIVLYIPKRYRRKNDEIYRIFTGVSYGSITKNEHIFETNALYPWLDNKTFNKWFVPSGETHPISMLPIKKADKYDFRRKAAIQMLDYLSTLGLVKEKHDNKIKNIQSSLFSLPNLIICGPSCTGKTVLATYLSQKYGYYHLEASDYMHLAFLRKHGASSNVNIHDFASQALREQPDIVSSEVRKEISELKSIPLIITGFRSIQEINEYLVSGGFELYYVDSDIKERYRRNLSRYRDDMSESYESFKEKDELQMSMGLRDIPDDERAHVIQNTSTLNDYLLNFVSNHIGTATPENTRNLSINNIRKSLTLEQAILLVLLIEKNNNDRWLTTTQISHEINLKLDKFRRNNRDESITTNKNNVSRYFNQRNYPYYKIANDEGTNRYKISASGISKAYLVLAEVT